MLKIIRSAIGSPVSTGFLKFLKENDIYVIGTDITELAVGRLLCDKFYIVPKSNFEDKVIDTYQQIIKSENASWIISGPEDEIGVLLKNQKVLNSSLFHLPMETFSIVTDKLELYKFLKENTLLPQPQTEALDLLNIKNFINSQKVILKPAKGRGSRGIIFTPLSEIEYYMSKLSNVGYIVQEIVEGKEFTVDTLHDFQGKVLNIIPRERIAVDSGVSIISRTTKNDQLIEMILTLSNKLKFCGANCFQFIKNEEEKYFLTDINPRFGGGSILSLRASTTFKKNVLNLLKNNTGGLTYNNFDFEELTMLRGYEEYYV